MNHNLTINGFDVIVSGSSEDGFLIQAPAFEIEHFTGTLSSVKSYLDAIREALWLHTSPSGYSLRIGKEKVELGTKELLDYSIDYNRAHNVSKIETVKCFRYILKIPSYGLEYVSDCVAQFVEDFSIVKDAFLEEAKFKYQPLMLVAEEVKSSTKTLKKTPTKPKKEKIQETPDGSLSLLSFL